MTIDRVRMLMPRGKYTDPWSLCARDPRLPFGAECESKAEMRLKMAIFAMPMADTPKLKIVIAGAGPAGLTAAKELQKRGSYDIVILEAESQVGGLAK
ncbi:MAG: NAD(P)-binding protein, partial [Bacteroidia bacterium]